MNEHRCILAHADGTCERVQCDQRKVATLLGGALTFAGAAGSNVVVVARVDDDPDTPVNALFGTHRHRCCSWHPRPQLGESGDL